MNVRSGAKYDQMSALHQNGQPTDENDGGNRLRGLHLRRMGQSAGHHRLAGEHPRRTEAGMSTTRKRGCTICRAGTIIRGGVGLSMRMGMRPQGKALLGTTCLRTVGITR